MTCESSFTTANETERQDIDSQNTNNRENKENVIEDPDKQKANKKSQQEMQNEKKLKQAEKLDLNEPCDSKCRKKCTAHLSNENRIAINNEYKKNERFG